MIVEAGCSDSVVRVATLIMVYVAMALLTYVISKTCEESNENSALLGIVWPITIAIVIAYWVVRWIAFPLIGAEKKDVERVERKIEELKTRIPQRINVTSARIPQNRWNISVGDLVVLKNGNPDGYKHLSEGSVSRVLSIDEETGAMRVILVDHKDFEEQKDYLGNEYKAPARLFKKKETANTTRRTNNRFRTRRR